MIEKFLDPIKLAFGLQLKEILSEAKIELPTYKAHRHQRAHSARNETLRAAVEYVLHKLSEANSIRHEYKVRLVQELTLATISIGDSMYADPLKKALTEFAAANGLEPPNFNPPE